MDSSQIITIVIAIYGAIVSTIVAVWNIRKDKTKLKVSISIGFLKISPEGEALAPFIDFQAVNASKRPITLKMLGIRLQDGTDKYFREKIGLPKKLLEGGMYNYRKNLLKFREELNKRQPLFLWFEDSVGNRYISDKKEFKEMLFWE